MTHSGSEASLSYCFVTRIEQLLAVKVLLVAPRDQCGARPSPLPGSLRTVSSFPRHHHHHHHRPRSLALSPLGRRKGWWRCPRRYHDIAPSLAAATADTPALEVEHPKHLGLRPVPDWRNTSPLLRSSAIWRALAKTKQHGVFEAATSPAAAAGGGSAYGHECLTCLSDDCQYK